MALAKCKECGEEISKKAKQCPKCGAPAKKKTSWLTLLVLATIGIVFTASTMEQNEKAEQVQRLTKVNADYFAAHSWDVLGDINGKIESGDYEGAIAVIDKYMVAGNKELEGLRKTATVKKIVTELKAVPASDVEKNAKLYAQLVELNPTVSKYKEKLNSYQGKADRLELIKSQFSPWDGSHRKLERLIKNAMNDPDSYEHDKTTYSDMGDYLVVKTVYRGKNGFGGMVRNFITAKVGLGGQIIKVIDQT